MPRLRISIPDQTLTFADGEGRALRVYAVSTATNGAPNRDWMLTRILWLSGCEVGFNRLGEVDTMRRYIYIYIHGTPDTMELGKPGSIGCIRMRNSDLVELFDLVPVCTPVEISANL